MAADARIDWLKRRVTHNLEISNKLFDELLQGKTHVEISTITNAFDSKILDVKLTQLFINDIFFACFLHLSTKK